MFEELAGKHIADLSEYKPGKPIEELKREFGLKNIIKMASNENPYGPSKKAVRAVREAEFSRYPLGDAYNLRAALSEKLKVEPGNLVFGSGSNEIIELLLRTYIHGGKTVLSPYPSFSVYWIISQAMGTKCLSVDFKDGFEFDVDAILKNITSQTGMIFLASPNNPTGTYISVKVLKELVARVPENVIIAMDQAYIEYACAKDIANTTHWFKKHPNVIQLCTFSKAYGLAGLRIGYGVGNKELIRMLNKVRQPFNTNTLAQAGAIAALKDEKYLQKVLKSNRECKYMLYKKFKKMGLEYVPSEANFILVKVGNGERVFNALLRKGVIVRYMGADLKEYIRVSIGTERECKIFINALNKVI